MDEYQDTNASQYELVKQLVGVRGALTAVGDDDQSVYAWRGARPENLALLQQDFTQPEANQTGAELPFHGPYPEVRKPPHR